jgi:hypothetical protein
LLVVRRAGAEEEICRDRSGDGLFLGRHFKAR